MVTFPTAGTFEHVPNSIGLYGEINAYRHVAQNDWLYLPDAEMFSRPSFFPSFFSSADADIAQWGEWYDNGECSKSCGCGSKEQARECPHSHCSNRLCEGKGYDICLLNLERYLRNGDGNEGETRVYMGGLPLPARLTKATQSHDNIVGHV